MCANFNSVQSRLDIFAYRKRIKGSILKAVYSSKLCILIKFFLFFRFDDIVKGKVPRDGMTVMYDVIDRKSVNKIQDIHTDIVFRSYMEHQKILDIVECMTGPNILAIHSMLIAKPPDIGFGSSR